MGSLSFARFARIVDVSHLPEPLERQQFETGQLMAEHPPVLHDRNKLVVFEIACPPGSAYSGRLDYSLGVNAAALWGESSRLRR